MTSESEHKAFDVREAQRHSLQERIVGLDVQNDSLGISIGKLEGLVAENQKTIDDYRAKLVDIELEDRGLKGLREQFTKTAQKLARSRTPILANLGRLAAGILDSELLEHLPGYIEAPDLSQSVNRVFVGKRKDRVEMRFLRDGRIGITQYHFYPYTSHVGLVVNSKGHMVTFVKHSSDSDLTDLRIKKPELLYYAGFKELNSLIVAAKDISLNLPEGTTTIQNSFHDFAAAAE